MTMNEFKMDRSVFRSIRATIGAQKAETGGMLGGPADNPSAITEFIFDQKASRSAVTYSPDTEFMNRVLADDWNPKGIRLKGEVHSHPPGCSQPSPGDQSYVCRFFETNKRLMELFLPIVQSAADRRGKFLIFPFEAVRRGQGIHIQPCRLRLLDDVSPKSTPSTVTGRAGAHLFEVNYTGQLLGDAFVRVTEAYDLQRTMTSRVIVAGVGGGAGCVESMVRAGVQDIILIDPDTVSESNLATQQYFRKDIGQPKVYCLRDRLLDINPLANVQAICAPIDDLDDRIFEQLATEPLRQWDVPVQDMWGLTGIKIPARLCIWPSATLLCAFTDSFPAQARLNRLGLQFGLPTLCAQMYQAGRAAEITCTYPGVTPACHRCVLRPRYEAYLNQAYRNTVTSNGTPIFATDRLNALKGYLAMALLHHGTDHPFWGKLVARIGDRNLIQIRLDPDSPLAVFNRVFGNGDTGRILFDEAVWLPQMPDGRANGGTPCPDCGGTGDLRKAIGTFRDTRVMRT